MEIYEPKREDKCPSYIPNKRVHDGTIYSDDDKTWFCSDVMKCIRPDWIECPSVKLEYNYLCRMITEHMFDMSDIPISSDKWNLIRSIEWLKIRFENLQGKIKLAGGLPEEE